MADQTDPNYQTPVYPENPLPDQGAVLSAETNTTPPLETPVDEPVMTNPPEESSVVAVANNNGGVPKWFYFLFGITLVVFFIVTVLLVLTYTKKQAFLPFLGNKGAVTSSPAISIPPSPTATPEALPSIIPTSPAASEVELKLPQLSAADEVPDLEKDINNTDFTKLDKAISNLDREMGIISP